MDQKDLHNLNLGMKDLNFFTILLACIFHYIAFQSKQEIKARTAQTKDSFFTLRGFSPPNTLNNKSRKKKSCNAK